MTTNTNETLTAEEIACIAAIADNPKFVMKRMSQPGPEGFHLGIATGLMKRGFVSRKFNSAKNGFVFTVVAS